MAHTKCRRCEELPKALPDSGTLILAPPLNHSAGKITTALRNEGMNPQIPRAGVITVAIDKDSLRGAADALAASLSARELKDTRAVVTSDHSGGSGYADLLEVHSLDSIIGRIQGEWLIRLLEHDRITIHFQPIVERRDPRRIFGYECLFRATADGSELLYPEQVLRVARRAEMLFYLDRTLRIRSIRAAAAADIDCNVFINFNPAAIYDPEFCLRTTVDAARSCGLDPEQIVFEVIESDRITDTTHLTTILRYYRDAGFRVALDDLGAGFSSLNLLSRLQPDFVKLDAELIRDVNNNSFKAMITDKLIEMAVDLGVRTVVEGVETEAEWNWLKSRPVDLVQGFLFARPAPELSEIAFEGNSDDPRQ